MSAPLYAFPLQQIQSQAGSAAVAAVLSCVEWTVPPGMRMVVTMLEHDSDDTQAFGIRRVVSLNPIITADIVPFTVSTFNPLGVVAIGRTGTVAADPGGGYLAFMAQRMPQYPRIVVDGGHRLTLIGLVPNTAVLASLEGVLTAAALDTAQRLLL